MSKPSELRLLLPLENPLVVYPELAKKIGLNQAIILQQLHYWLTKYENDPTHIVENQVWVYNTISEWQVNFGFWSEKTIQRTIANLVTLNLVNKANHNVDKQVQTLWYTINYEEFTRLFDVSKPYGQLVQLRGTTCPTQQVKLSNSILAENTTENTTEREEKKETLPPIPEIEIETIKESINWKSIAIQQLQELTGQPINNSKLILALLEMFQSLDDFNPFLNFLTSVKKPATLDFANSFNGNSYQTKSFIEDCLKHYNAWKAKTTTPLTSTPSARYGTPAPTPIQSVTNEIETPRIELDAFTIAKNKAYANEQIAKAKLALQAKGFGSATKPAFPLNAHIQAKTAIKASEIELSKSGIKTIPRASTWNERQEEMEKNKAIALRQLETFKITI